MRKRVYLVAVAVLAPSPAGAHITPENKQATIGSYCKAVFAVPPDDFEVR
jgi:periplasmic copper chaperone A